MTVAVAASIGRREFSTRVRPGRVLVIIGTYPLVTTTFIDREIRGLRRLGVDLRLLSLRRPPADVTLSTDQRALAREVTYLLPTGLRFVLSCHGWAFARRPIRYVETLAHVVTRPHPDLRSRLKTVVHFGQGVCVARVADRVAVDELYAHFVDRAATVALTASRFLGLPYHVSVHAGADLYVHPVMVTEKLRGATHVTTCTQRNKERLAEIAGEEFAEKVHVVPHGLDFASMPTPLPARAGDPVLLAVGQLAERKGLHILVTACARLRAQGYRFKCRVVGSGPQLRGLERLARSVGVADVVDFVGSLPQDAVLEEYARATVFVLPCLRARSGDVDGIPNVLLEAMAMRLPVVSSDQPAIRELMSDGENGLLAAPGDDADLARALAELLDRRDLRNRLAGAGRETVRRHFDIEANVRSLANVLWPGSLPIREESDDA